MSADKNCDEILRQLNADEVNDLLKIYKSKYGKQDFHYLLLYNQCKWNQKLKDLGLDDCKNNNEESEKWISFRKTFYTHRNCDFRKFGTYISLHFDLIQSVSFHSWEPGFLDLYECLENTKLINWRDGPLLTDVSLEYCDKVKEVALSKGVEVQRARLCQGIITSREKALQFDVPSLPIGYKIKPLEEENALQVHEMWANKKEGSLQFIKGLIKINKTLGIFNEKNNDMIAWIFQNDFSGLGILQVLPVAQRKGLGKFLAVALSKHIAETEDVDISAYHLVENEKSKALFEKIGFKKCVLHEWIQLKKCD